MKIQSLLIAGMLLVPCFVVNAKSRVTHEEPATNEIAQTEENCGCECLALPTPMLEKVSSKCSVKCNCPSTCFQVCKTVSTTYTYRIPSNCQKCCQITDDKGTRPCCEKTCSVKCDKCPRRHCNHCGNKAADCGNKAAE
jgi:hypothetical protein